ncbi:hypothetical protein O181_007707 [Austropuccinia psidii MF-1]|uniref:Uncharacterized protein n=1 Tax=Austropuccinia psidii MF-1 TaxID=1389203 RepID=A0A9Q3BMG4_9BASI|nr:hypothetical protein [Austropuccinia psidii MF-1]
MDVLVTEGQGSLNEAQTYKLSHSEADNNLFPSNGAYNTTRRLSGNTQSHPEGIQKLTSTQRVSNNIRPLKKCMSSYLTVRKFLGPTNTFKLLNGWHPLIKKKKMMLSTAEWRKRPPPPKQVTKTTPVSISRNLDVKKKPQAQNKSKGKAPATKPYSQGYRISKIQQDAMKNVFQIFRTMMEMQKREEARFKYKK